MQAQNISLELLGQDLLVMRITPGTHVNNNVVNEGFDVVNNAHLPGPLGVVLVLPDDLDFDAQVISTDHRRRLSPRQHVRALAIVATSMMTGTMVDLHFAYYPSGSAVRCFRDLDEAIAWAAQTGFQRSVA
jgi:hypothetical protein